jgi:uncharacterized membrane-anchored protein YhcB (DUF1043 family)
VSRALWIDIDGSGSREAPLDHARRLVDKHASDTAEIVKALSSYDQSVATHVLNLLRSSGRNIQ